MTTEYFISYWGADEDRARQELGLDSQDLYFDSEYAMLDVLEKLKHYPDLATRIETGQLSHRPTTVRALMSYNGRLYEVEDAFGHEYPADTARWVWEEGNMSCDCNRADAIAEKYPDFIYEFTDIDEFGNKDYECGSMIKLERILVDGGEGIILES
uniref:Uncharacterized protein n=1 Tax=viral metagenome TaxID=1070528 RepID=A0A6M3JR51_9ZZZZ